MGVCSKLVSSVPFNCYEIAHPWTTSCSHAWSYLFFSCLQQSGRVYSMLYLFSQLAIARKISPEAFLTTLQSIARSSIFLSYNVFFFLFFICVFRMGSSRLYLQQSTFVSGFLSSFISIFIEKPNRRKMLSLYMLNLFSEVLFNFSNRRGFVPSVPYGDVLLFVIAMAGHTALMTEVNGKDPISKVLMYFVGKKEFLLAPRRECNHKGPCAQYAFSGFVQPFLMGYLGRCALSLVSSIPQLISNPTSLTSIFLNRRNFNQGLFLGGFTASFRLVRCLLRAQNVEDKHSRALAGFMGALCIAMSRNKSLSLYVFWKTVETYYLLGHSKGLLPNVPLSRELIYAASCGFMLFTAVVEPHNVRPSYLKFLNNITGTALSKVNRHPCRSLGYESTVSYPDYFPYDLDLSKVSRRFMELVVVWS